MKHFALGLALACMSCISASVIAGDTQDSGSLSMDTVKHLGDFQAIEFRRYNTSAGEREHFTAYFEGFFPEAMQQLGALVLGSFHERDNPTGFTWLRGFHEISDRAIVNSAFYYGPVWKEHRTTVNAILPDSDNVMLLTPLTRGRGVMVLPSVDPVNEAQGAGGVVVAEIFSVKKGSEDAFARKAETVFARYRATGAREAGVLVTLDVPNNFPQLPIRSDGPFLVWLGILKDEKTLETRFKPLEQETRQSLTDTGMLRNAPEVVIMDPTKRSRLRWLPTWQQ